MSSLYVVGMVRFMQHGGWVDYIAIEEREVRSCHMHSYGIQARTTTKNTRVQTYMY